MDGTGLPHDEVEMRRMYCELADSFSSILSTGTGTEHESRPTNGSFGIHVTRDHGDFGNGRHYTSVGFIASNAEGSTLFSQGIVGETRRTGTDSGGNPRSGILLSSLLDILFWKSMDCTRLSDTKDNRSTGDVFKKKFTSLSRPRQPLKETNANLPTLPFKRNKRNSSSYSSPKGKDNKKLSPKKHASATQTVPPIAEKTGDQNSPIREKETTSLPVCETPTETGSSQLQSAIKECANGIPVIDNTTREVKPISRKRKWETEKEFMKQAKPSGMPSYVPTLEKVQQAATWKEESYTVKQLSEQQENNVSEENASKSGTTGIRAPGTTTQSEVANLNQHNLIQPISEKPRTLIDAHETSKNSNVKAPLQPLNSNQVDRKSLEKRKPAQQNTQHQKGTARLSGEELYQWQQSWKKIMRESVVFFEGAHDFQSSEYKKAVKYLKYVGSEIAPFYRTNVTIIISKRTYDDKFDYPTNDIFSNVPKFKTKVWSYDKLFRFMKNLGLSNISDDQLSTGANANSTTTTNYNNLYNLLKEEKLYGVADRDPNAKRDDFHYFGKNYLYVYDLSQSVRPIAVREWGNDYPTMHLTLDGKCPFIEDQSDQNSERKRLKRIRKFEATKAHRQALRSATERVINGISLSTGRFNGTSTSTDKIEESSNGEVAEFRQPLTRNSSCIQSKAVDAMASGFNGASNAVQFSMDSNLNSTAMAAGNGLGPSLSQVQSKNLNNLKRRIFLKRKTSERRDKESTPGYCENCRCKYDNFEDHIYSNRHRNFACDDRNFVDIDELIATLQESNSMGNITSNGDYI
ncbi:DBF4 [Candida metapsilosis]|uniref:DBF4 n=1 Tax=Candida metapsilosis TaxID=273372 RepID=A0A8H7ZIV4_9ASCO|nr:DBF4 [Candida metapsilosis]